MLSLAGTSRASLDIQPLYAPNASPLAQKSTAEKVAILRDASLQMYGAVPAYLEADSVQDDGGFMIASTLQGGTSPLDSMPAVSARQ
jgi:hypothetical protein